MSNKSSFDFYCLWEELSNPNFKLAEFREFKIGSATQSFMPKGAKRDGGKWQVAISKGVLKIDKCFINYRIFVINMIL